MERSYNNPEYIAYIKNNIKHAKDTYICVSCFDTKERKVKKENIVRIPKRTMYFRECDTCGSNKNGTCQWCPEPSPLQPRSTAVHGTIQITSLSLFFISSAMSVFI